MSTTFDPSGWGHEIGSPVNDSEQIKELTYEEEFYSHDVELPEFALVYINQLELELKAVYAKNKDARVKSQFLIDLCKQTEKSYLIGKITEIKNLLK